MSERFPQDRTQAMMWNRDHLCELPHVIVQAMCNINKAPQSESNAKTLEKTTCQKVIGDIICHFADTVLLLFFKSAIFQMMFYYYLSSAIFQILFYYCLSKCTFPNTVLQLFKLCFITVGIGSKITVCLFALRSTCKGLSTTFTVESSQR